MRSSKKIATILLSIAVVSALCVPIASYANTDTSDSADLITQSDGISSANATDDSSMLGNNTESNNMTEESGVSSNVSNNCTATIKYYENVTYEEPGIAPDNSNRYLLGTREITGLSEGEVLDAWDYIADIQGFFFFDGWPAKLTVSSNPEDNIMELFYFRYWTNSYTVNYYLMEGADLTADNWTEALSPDDVEFIKFGSETFDNQPFGALVEADAYEYRIDGTYAIDAYPAQIRLGTDPDNNVINLLYAPDSAHLPDDIEIIEGDSHPDGGSGDISEGVGGSSGSAGDSTSPSNPTAPSTPAAPAKPIKPADPTPVPDDQVFSKDDLVAALPDNMTKQEIDQLFRDFIGSEADAGNLQITDEMLEKTVDPSEAQKSIDAFNTGLEQGKAEGNCGASLVDHIWCIIIMIILLVLAIIGYVLYYREHRRNKELLEKSQSPEQMEDQSPNHTEVS